MSLLILSPGPLSTIQDAGRFGMMQTGMTPSGVMDRDAYQAANELVGNGSGLAVIECTLMGMTLRFTEDHVFALTGAEMQARLDDQPIERYCTHQAQAGQMLQMGYAVEGCRAYLAVRGGMDVPVVMGSRSTNVKCEIGGYQGRALRSGDIIPVGNAIGAIRQHSMAAPSYAHNIRVRVVEGPQAAMFTQEAAQLFYAQTYQVTQDADRMGIRLSGIALPHKGVDIISDGIVFGAIQITTAGQPIVMMADHQTTGGYAKIATVCTVDLPLLAQARPGDTVTFERMDIQAAQRLLQQKTRFHKLGAWIGRRKHG